MFTVAGVTGKVGSVVARTLLDAGQKIRVLVRDEAKGAEWKQRGAEVAVGNVNDVASLTRALQGAEGAFLLVPPDFPGGEVYEHQKKVVRALATAVRESKVPHVVLLSSIGAQHETGTGPIRGLHHAEKELAATGASLSSIRAASFMDNWGAVLPAAIHQGILPSFVDEKTSVAMVSTRDIGELAAKALRDPAKGRRIYNLAGPKEYQATDVVAAVGRALGKPVQLVTVPLQGALGALTQSGVPEFLAKAFVEMYEGQSKGLLAWEPAHELVRGKVTIDEAVKQMVAAPPAAH